MPNKMKFQLLLTLITLEVTLDTVLAHHRSPLFGSSSAGDQFDDGAYAFVPPVTGIRSLLIRHGTYVNGIQAVYALADGQNNTSPYHGGPGGFANLIQFTAEESLIRVEGERRLGDTPDTQYLTCITLYTRNARYHSINTYGPFGKSLNVTGHSYTLFSFAGAIVGFFGRSRDSLNAIGFDINVHVSIDNQPYYKGGMPIGGPGGKPFYDYTLWIYFSFRIKSLLIRAGTIIEGIETTYVITTGETQVIGRGALHKTATVLKPNESLSNTKENTTIPGNNGTKDTCIYLDDDERITRIDIAPGRYSLPYVMYLKLYTTNSKGVEKTYGPFGTVPLNGIVTINGVINSFFGREGEYINALGFYT